MTGNLAGNLAGNLNDFRACKTTPPPESNEGSGGGFCVG
jgi:hypothetical protein